MLLIFVLTCPSSSPIVDWRDVNLTGRNAVELSGDSLQGSQGDAAQERGEQRRDQHGDRAPLPRARFKPWRNPSRSSADDMLHADFAERR